MYLYKANVSVKLLFNGALLQSKNINLKHAYVYKHGYKSNDGMIYF